MSYREPFANAHHEKFRTTKFFSSLDGLRCFSVLAVIWHHVGGHVYSLPILHRGNQGVTLFFCISGFLITTLLIREKDGTGGVDLKKFYARRSLRIFPLYYLVFLIYLALAFFVERDSSDGQGFMANAPAFATYTSNWFVGSGMFYFAWSLATEEQFYLVWPWIQKYTKFWFPAVFMFGLLAIAFCSSYGYLGPQEGFYPILMKSIAPGICLGAILAHLLHHKSTFPAMAMVLGSKISPLIFLMIFVGYCFVPHIDFWVSSFIGMLLVGACVCREDHVFKKPLGIPLIKKSGVISYGMYMLHSLVISFYVRAESYVDLDQFLARLGINSILVQFLAVSILTYLAASFSYRFFETYFLNFKKYFLATPTAK